MRRTRTSGPRRSPPTARAISEASKCTGQTLRPPYCDLVPPGSDDVPEHTPASTPGRVRLVVLFGGRSAEHEVSCVSALHVLRAADPARYRVVPIGITREGRWVEAADA